MDKIEVKPLFSFLPLNKYEIYIQNKNINMTHNVNNFYFWRIEESVLRNGKTENIITYTCVQRI